MSAKTDLSKAIYDREMAMLGAATLDPSTEYTEAQYRTAMLGVADHFITDPAWTGGADQPVLCDADPAFPDVTATITELATYVAKMTVSKHAITQHSHCEYEGAGSGASEAAAIADALSGWAQAGGTTDQASCRLDLAGGGGSYTAYCKRVRKLVRLSGLSAVYTKSVVVYWKLRAMHGTFSNLGHSALLEDIWGEAFDFGDIGADTECDSDGLTGGSMFGEVSTFPVTGWVLGANVGYDRDGSVGPFALVSWTFVSANPYPQPRAASINGWTLIGGYLVSRQPDDSQTSDDNVYRLGEAGWENVTPDAADFPAAPVDEELWNDTERLMEWRYNETVGKWRARPLTRPVNPATTPYEFIATLADGVLQPDGSYRYVIDFPEPVDTAAIIIPQVTLAWRTSQAVVSICDMWLVLEVGTSVPSSSDYYEQDRAYVSLTAQRQTILQ